MVTGAALVLVAAVAKVRCGVGGDRGVRGLEELLAVLVLVHARGPGLGFSPDPLPSRPRPRALALALALAL